MADAIKFYSDLQLVRLTWCGSSNVIRAKCIHAPSCKNWEKVSNEGVGLCTGVEALPIMYDSISPNSGIGPVGEVRLKPDWSTLTPVPYAKGQVRVMVNMYEDGSGLVNAGERSQHCPRGFLERMIDEAAKIGYVIKAGFENEFILLQRTEDGSIKAVDDTVYCSTLSIDSNYEVMREIIDALTQQGIEIELYHPESATGQQELSIRYTDVLKAADQQIIIRETVKAIALKHNRIATFIPCLWPNQAGNGCHIHFSIHDITNGTNLVPSPTRPNEISDVTSHFIAGILEHLKGIMALSCPTTNSMRRIVPGHWSGAYHTWGYGNREAPVRVPANGSQPSPTHFELKASDTAGNPYFVLGIVIAAGLDGIKRKLPLREPYQDDPGLLSEEEREKLNIIPLPSDLRETIDALSKDQVLLDALQPKLSKAILAVRESEYKAMKDMSFEEERKLLLQRY